MKAPAKILRAIPIEEDFAEDEGIRKRLPQNKEKFRRHDLHGRGVMRIAGGLQGSLVTNHVAIDQSHVSK